MNKLIFKQETQALTDALTYIFDAVNIINDAKGTNLSASDVVDVERVMMVIKESKCNTNPTVEDLYNLGNTLQLVHEALEIMRKNNKELLKNLYI